MSNVQTQYLVQTVIQLPEPPAGDSWHNPEKISVERIPDGMRFLTKKELHYNIKHSAKDFYYYDTPSRFSGRWEGNCDSYTYFTDKSYPIWERPQFLGDVLAANKFYGAVNCIGLKGLIVDSSFRSGKYKVHCLFEHFTDGNRFTDYSSLGLLRGNFRVYEFDSLLELAKWAEKE